MSKTPYRVLVVDDHPLVRKGLVDLVAETPELEICGEFSSGEEALKMIGSCDPDIVVVDIALPGMNGVELIKRIRNKDSEVRILVSSMHDEAIYGARCLKAGANGYIEKDAATRQVLDAIMQTMQRGIYLTPQALDRVLHAQSSNQEIGVNSLTDREFEVFSLIGKGMRLRDMAERLHISVKTVETHRDHIREKLGIANSTELMRYAVQWTLEN